MKRAECGDLREALLRAGISAHLGFSGPAGYHIVVGTPGLDSRQLRSRAEVEAELKRTAKGVKHGT